MPLAIVEPTKAHNNDQNHQSESGLDIHPIKSPSDCLQQAERNEMSSVTNSDIAPPDQVQLADLADAKLRRQQQRIIDNDAALLATKSKPGRKAKTDWKPFNLANSSDDNFSMSDSAESRNPTPFDVHAKIFKPSATSSRDNSPSRPFSMHNPVKSASKLPILLPADDGDDGGDFQLVTGRKMRPLPRPALALNAYESKSADKLHTVAASFDKKQINEVFGNDLPPPEFVQSVPGLQNGQVQFVMHPNGDVAAQQWSIEKFQWTNIGQYSNTRRRREGLLAAQRLKGETEQQSLMQNTLAYFRAVAKQCEATTMGLTWGPKDNNAYLPAPPSYTSPTRQKSEDSMVKRQPASPAPSFSMPMQFPITRRSEPTMSGAPVMPKLPHADTHSSLDSMSFGGFGASLPKVDNRPDRGWPIAEAHQLTEHFSPGPQTSDMRYLNQTWSDFQVPGDKQSTGISAAIAGLTPLSRDTTAEFTATHGVSSQKSDNPWQGRNRSAMKEALNKLGQTATARGLSMSGASRTVLHDPMRSKNAFSQQESPLRAPSLHQAGSSSDYQSLCDITFSTSSPQRQPGISGVDARRDFFGVSEPDPGPWNPRTPGVGDRTMTNSFSNGQFATYTAPTPQNWNGPFFTGSPKQEVNKKSYDEELHDWFTGGNTRARQDEFYERIMAAHNNFATAPRCPGPIQPPGATSTPRHKDRKSTDFNEGTTRLLIPVLENLASYVEGPVEKRHGPFARWAPPPEWCIDRGPNGNKSFFGDDWGQPPERIGRDSRYRPMPNQGRFGNFEPPPAIGTLSSLGRSVQPLDGRFKFGPGRKW